MPKKVFHVVSCPLSRRQRFLYEDYINRRQTRETLGTGSFLGMMGVLMQLRKVCNHPDLFEPRPITSPFICDAISIDFPREVALETPGALRAHEVNRAIWEAGNRGSGSQAESRGSGSLSDAALEACDWRRVLRLFPAGCQNVCLPAGRPLFARETESRLSVGPAGIRHVVRAASLAVPRRGAVPVGGVGVSSEPAERPDGGGGGSGAELAAAGAGAT